MVPFFRFRSGIFVKETKKINDCQQWQAFVSKTQQKKKGDNMSISKVWIEEDCISCYACEEICPAVFVVDDRAKVILNADFVKHGSEIEAAAEACPVAVIKYE